ncbi:hypothetical protein BDB00DRAFT_792119 [Zychaea mexicana]|uniref:uncharacterized protein n=1 Tax=Zychaea mexicana TaxID=64656 RepID=UPI0022FDB256|nr:uncharacterized protein BDB00DRAFT_792119 [Zychaea mexicana]KAI9488152.1 hypothetical protein BDB00DRAFT_792119 [Zychaea mexicana]
MSPVRYKTALTTITTAAAASDTCYYAKAGSNSDDQAVVKLISDIRYTQLSCGLKDPVRFNIQTPCGIFHLICCDWMNLVRTAERFDIASRKTLIANFAFYHRLYHSLDSILDGSF